MANARESWKMIKEAPNNIIGYLMARILGKQLGESGELMDMSLFPKKEKPTTAPNKQDVQTNKNP